MSSAIENMEQRIRMMPRADRLTLGKHLRKIAFILDQAEKTLSPDEHCEFLRRGLEELKKDLEAIT